MASAAPGNGMMTSLQSLPSTGSVVPSDAWPIGPANAPVEAMVPVLFRVALDGKPFSVVVSDRVGALPSVRSRGVRSDLEIMAEWSIVEIRDDSGQATTVHAIGLCDGGERILITPALDGFCSRTRTAYDRRVAAYRLSPGESAELSAELCLLLIDALQGWGFEFVAG